MVSDAQIRGPARERRWQARRPRHLERV